MASKAYIAIDLKSFYASVECVDRGLDPLDTNLVVADPTRTRKPSVSPSPRPSNPMGSPAGRDFLRQFKRCAKSTPNVNTRLPGIASAMNRIFIPSLLKTRLPS